MLLILRHTFSSLVPRQSRPLQNVNTTSVTTNLSGHICCGAARVRFGYFAVPPFRNQACIVSFARSILLTHQVLFSVSCQRGVSCHGLGTRQDCYLRCEPPVREARQTGLRLLPNAPRLQPHRRAARHRPAGQVSTSHMLYGAAQDNLESFPRQLAQARPCTGPGKSLTTSGRGGSSSCLCDGTGSVRGACPAGLASPLLASLRLLV